MLLETYNRLDQPQRTECRRALLRDNFGNPFCVIIESGPGKYWVKHLGDKDFFKALELLGVQDTVVVDRYQDNPSGLIMPSS